MYWCNFCGKTIGEWKDLRIVSSYFSDGTPFSRDAYRVCAECATKNSECGRRLKREAEMAGTDRFVSGTISYSYPGPVAIGTPNAENDAPENPMPAVAKRKRTIREEFDAAARRAGLVVRRIN